MLTDLRQAPVIEDDTFMHHTRKLLMPEAVVIKQQQCAWVETDGTMYCNEEEYEAVGVLVPVQHISTKSMWDNRPIGGNQWSGAAPACTEFPMGEEEVVLNDENGGGMLNAYSILLQRDGIYAAHVFNGHANEIIHFDEGDTLDDIFDTVYTMFAVTGSEVRS